MSNEAAPVWVNVKQLVARFGGAFTISAVYAWAHAGVVRSSKLGGRVLVDLAHVERMLADNATGPGAESVPEPVEQPPARRTTPPLPRAKGGKKRRPFVNW